MLSAYLDGLADMPEPHVLEACRRWPTLPERGKWFPALEELRSLADDVACEHRVRALPKPPVSRFGQVAPQNAGPVIKDPAGMRQTIAQLRSTLKGIPGAAHLAAMGETMLARWEQAR